MKINVLLQKCCLGCILANIFMGYIEKNLHDSIEAHSSWYVRYVDDTFIVVPSGQSALRLLKALNNAHPSLHFTHELEKQGVLPFLDVSVIRNSDGRFSTTVYRKPTFSGVFLNFNSFSPISSE